MKHNLRVAMAQINSTVGDLEGNARKVGEYIDKAHKHKACLVAFPELAVMGYPPQDLLTKNPLSEKTRRCLNRLLKAAK